jgi:polysaccharide deacetylase 2 family uncharacterized protein YibQ
MSTPDRARARRAVLFGTIAAAALVLGGIAAIAAFGTPSDGDPHVSLALDGEAGEGVRQPLPTGGAARYSNGQLVSDLALLEDSPDGPLPVIGPDRRTPMQAYAAKFSAPRAQPRIAVVVTGLGVSDNGTALALSRLPPAVTLSFVTAAENLQIRIDEARGRGHEVLLDVPMEPFDFPDSDPGPNALLVNAESSDNIRRLQRHLGRATGYVGIGNLMGNRFLGEATALQPVLAAVASRGLLFFDNGANANSVAITVARHAQAPLAVGSVVLDQVQTAEAIDTRLAELESQAMENGSAVGTASVFPVTIERVAEWAAGLEARGLALAPLTAVASQPAPR